MEENKVGGKYDSSGYAWVAVNPDGEYRIFKGKPFRNKEEIEEEDLSVTEEDHYGKEYHPWKKTGKFREYWDDYNHHGPYHGYWSRPGAIVDKSMLPRWMQSMSWSSNPQALY